MYIPDATDPLLEKAPKNILHAGPVSAVCVVGHRGPDLEKDSGGQVLKKLCGLWWGFSGSSTGCAQGSRVKAVYTRFSA